MKIKVFNITYFPQVHEVVTFYDSSPIDIWSVENICYSVIGDMIIRDAFGIPASTVLFDSDISIKIENIIVVGGSEANFSIGNGHYRTSHYIMFEVEDDWNTKMQSDFDNWSC